MAIANQTLSTSGTMLDENVRVGDAEKFRCFAMSTPYSLVIDYHVFLHFLV